MTGFIRTLRLLYPKADIKVLTDPLGAEVLAGNPDVNETIASENIRFQGSVRRYVALLLMLRKLGTPQLDAIFLLHFDYASLLLMRLARSRYKVGYDNGTGGAFALTHKSPVFTHPKGLRFFKGHLGSSMHDLLRALRGGEISEHAPVLLLSAPEVRRANELVARQKLVRPIVAFALGTIPPKQWPVRNFVQLARECLRRFGGSVMVFGGKDVAEHEIAFQDAGGRIYFAAGKLTLRESLSLVSVADAVVGADTGLMHAAVALDVPVVTLFGPTLVTNFGYTGPRCSNLVGKLECVPCGSPRCRLLPAGITSTAPCMETILPEEVVAELQALLAASPGHFRTRLGAAGFSGGEYGDDGST